MSCCPVKSVTLKKGCIAACVQRAPAAQRRRRWAGGRAAGGRSGGAWPHRSLGERYTRAGASGACEQEGRVTGKSPSAKQSPPCGLCPRCSYGRAFGRAGGASAALQGRAARDPHRLQPLGRPALATARKSTHTLNTRVQSRPPAGTANLGGRSWQGATQARVRTPRRTGHQGPLEWRGWRAPGPLWSSPAASRPSALQRALPKPWPPAACGKCHKPGKPGDSAPPSPSSPPHPAAHPSAPAPTGLQPTHYHMLSIPGRAQQGS